jgi:ribonuclease VapC
MVIDTSAILAILQQEPEANRLLRAIVQAPRRLLSAVSFFEAAMLARYRAGDVGSADYDRLLTLLNLEVVPVTERQAQIARDAHRRFGKGLHPAGLNFGDCFTYALAAESGEPLLFKGSDFSRTDLRAASY